MRCGRRWRAVPFLLPTASGATSRAVSTLPTPVRAMMCFAGLMRSCATSSICSGRACATSVRACRGTTDFKTGREWPLEYCTDIDYNELDRPTDVKVPWELSRCQHFTRFGQAYWLTATIVTLRNSLPR